MAAILFGLNMLRRDTYAERARHNFVHPGSALKASVKTLKDSSDMDSEKYQASILNIPGL